jgi:putative nucleotidyltransferase with HDIG domain
MRREEARQRVRLWLDRLPPFPFALQRLLGTIGADPDEISLTDVAELVETDTLIAGKVLGVANSSLYSRGHPVCSIRQAVVRLGVLRLRNVLLSLSINRVWGGLVLRDDFPILRFNRHALATAILADLLAQELRLERAETAFAAGLFHDVGQLVLVATFPDEYISLLEQAADGAELELLENEALSFSHAEISAEATAHWNLPRDVQTAVRFHEHAIDQNRIARLEPLTLRDAVHAADRCATALGMSIVDGSADSAIEESLAPLGVEQEEILGQFLRQMDAIDECERRSSPGSPS